MIDVQRDVLKYNLELYNSYDYTKDFSRVPLSTQEYLLASEYIKMFVWKNYNTVYYNYHLEVFHGAENYGIYSGLYLFNRLNVLDQIYVHEMIRV